MAALGGCGGSAARRLRVPCTQKGLAAISRSLRLRASAVTAMGGTGNNASPECAYSAGRVSVVVNVDSGPQPYFVLERTAIEASQQFSSAHNALEVDHVGGVGLDAFWIPSERQFLTTDGVRLLTVTATWPGASPARLRALGESAARAYLGPSRLPPGYQG